MCNGKKDDADKAGLFLPETNSHPASNIPRSAFCPLNGASIGPSLATLPFSAAAAFLYVVCSISYFHLSCKIRLLHIGSKKKKVVYFCTTFKTNLQIIKKWVSPIRTHPWSECRDSNPGPLGPEPSAIPNFATPRSHDGYYYSCLAAGCQERKSSPHSKRHVRIYML